MDLIDGKHTHTICVPCCCWSNAKKRALKVAAGIYAGMLYSDGIIWWRKQCYCDYFHMRNVSWLVVHGAKFDGPDPEDAVTALHYSNTRSLHQISAWVAIYFGTFELWKYWINASTFKANNAKSSLLVKMWNT